MKWGAEDKQRLWFWAKLQTVFSRMNWFKSVLNPSLMLIRLATTAVFLASAISAQSSHIYDMSQPAGGSRIDFAMHTLLGKLDGDDYFDIPGEIGFEVTSPVEPFLTGQLREASTGPLVMTPLVHGWIPNPLPLLPHLVDVYARDLEFYFSGLPFPIDSATGNFMADAIISFTNGEIEIISLGVTTIWPMASLGSDPFQIPGRIKQYGGKVEAILDFDLRWADSYGGMSLAVDCSGLIPCEALIPGVSPSLNVPALVAGQQATFDYSGGIAQSTTWLGASVQGLGTTPIAPLHIQLDLQSPIPVSTSVTDAAGNCSWTLQVPNASGLSVWFQACQMGLTTPVVATSVQ